MAGELNQITLTRAARDVIDLAEGCGLRPHVGPDGPGGYGRGRTSVAVDSGMRSGLFGTIVVDQRGRILRAFLMHGNHSVERRYDGAAEVRTVISSWAAIVRSVREETRA
jgi:hypothetical protein